MRVFNAKPGILMRSYVERLCRRRPDAHRRRPVAAPQSHEAAGRSPADLPRRAG
jgi:hypothetical protein